MVLSAFQGSFCLGPHDAAETIRVRSVPSSVEEFRRRRALIQGAKYGEEENEEDDEKEGEALGPIKCRTFVVQQGQRARFELDLVCPCAVLNYGGRRGL